ncbi:NTF2-like protein [Coprinopsis marcescibilis]|uniref:NTF2-like protein n=1 Tax=Coprinopsis marcescibilis TaxID=230819 RepID=A0A5C3L5B3_COPMA|nr:NTF2-like protein [Coprinopsis marcescibilis]
MFSQPTAAPKTLVASALRNAGLMDKDTQMRDATERPGGRKGLPKHRSHRNRAIDAFKDRGPGRTLSTSARISSSASHAGPSNPLSIRGASRPTATGRLRRNAVSAGGMIATGGPRTTVGKPKAVESWREVVRKRWNPELQLLNLERLIDDDLVKNYNLAPPGTGGGNAREAAVIFKLASELKPPVKSLTLANNNLNGDHLHYLARYLPKLVNLSLENNKLGMWKDLDSISARKDKLVHLRELVLTGNPVRELEIKNGRGDRYKQELTRRFTSLEVLDSEPITQIGFDVPTGSTTIPVKKPDAKTFPYEMGPSFVTGVPDDLVSRFLARFFNYFDSQRDALVPVYAPNATFSYSINTSIPQRAKMQSFHHTMPNQKKLEWSKWLNVPGGGSRNLSRISGGIEKAVKSLHFGGEDAVKAMKGLPNTRHDITGPPEKFSLDAFPVPIGQGMGLLVTLHGEFTEAGAEGLRSFDRTFVLALAPEGSSAQLNGWEVVIMSDQWIVRIYSSHEAWLPGPMLVQALPRQGVSKTPQQVFESLVGEQRAEILMVPESHRDPVLQLMGRTNLNVKFAFQCLEGNGWNFDRAIANFEQVKASLGRDAYL